MSKGTQEAHTPGPWKWDQSRGAVTAGDVGRGVPRLHITPTWRDQDTPESLANARLIAAAPDLLAACKALVALETPTKPGQKCCYCNSIHCDIPRCPVALAGIAIAKAGGAA